MDGYTMICLVFILCIMYLLLKRYIYSLKIISKDKYVLITGCDSGFGYLLANRLDAIGMNVIAGCLQESSIVKLGNALSKKQMAIRLDVTNDTSIAEAVELVNATLGDHTGLWALVNNAGLMGTGIGPTVWQTRKDYEDVLSVNFFGVAMVTNAFLPFVLNGKGRIVNIASMKGRIAFHNAPYSVSKYGVEAFSDCLRRDLYNKGVTVHILEPGHFETNLLDRATHRKRIHEKIESLPKSVRDELSHDIKDIMMARFQSFVGRMASIHPEEVVDTYEHAITAKYPKYRYVIGFDAKYIFQPLWMLPEFISDFVITRLRDLYNKDVTVHILEPGHFETNLLDRATHRKRIHEKTESLPKSVRDELPHDIKDIMMARVQSFVGRMASNHPEEVVDAYEHAITAKHPKYRYVIGFDAKYIFQPLWMLLESISDFVITRL